MADLRVDEGQVRHAAARLRAVGDVDLVADPGAAAAATGHSRLADAAAVVGAVQRRAAEAVAAEAANLAQALDDSVDALAAADRRMARSDRAKPGRGD